MAPSAHRQSRARRRERELAEARAVIVPDACDVCVVGGGAAGLACAITAAEAGARVVVLEREASCGKKILATGNGRCNFCNVMLDVRRYNQPAFVGDVCGGRWLDDVLGFFRDAGLAWSLEDDRLYPVSRQAASVLSALLARARRAGVTLAPARTVVGVALGGEAAPHVPSGGHGEAAPRVIPSEASAASAAEGPPTTCTDSWLVTYQGAWPDAAPEALAARAVVLAVGGGAVAGLAAPLGLALVPDSPVLVPLACEPSPLSALDGRRAQVAATLWRGRLSVARERGEALLRDYGLSGIVTFDLSRQARPGDVITLDLLPDLGVSEILRIVDASGRGSFAQDAFDGLLDPAIAAVLGPLARDRWRLAGDERLGVDAPTSDTEAMVSLVKGLPFRVSGVAHPELAQVTRGGLAVSQVVPETLGLSCAPGLFACGEALDVDGDCGGFNLAWAWKSGMVAGEGAARHAAQAAEGAARHAAGDAARHAAGDAARRAAQAAEGAAHRAAEGAVR